MNQSSSRRKGRVALPEDVYQENLSQIIQRDYFPSLHQLRPPAENTASTRPPRSIVIYEQEVTASRRPLHEESLTGFHARVTSEDNAAFEKQVAQEVRTNREKAQRILFEGGPSASTIRKNLSPLPLASDQFLEPAPPRQSSVAKARNTLFFVPGSDQETATKDGKSAREEALMPPPKRKDTSTGRTSEQLVEYASNSNQKCIQPAATRFPKKPLVVAKPLADEWDAESCSSSDASTDLDDEETEFSIEAEKLKGRKRKERERETMVEMTPLVVPGASPITTWGAIGATPLAIGQKNHQRSQPSADTARSGVVGADKNETDASNDIASFRMPPANHREDAAIRAQARIAQRVRRAKETPRRRTETPLSTAAKQMLRKSNMSRPMSARSSNAFGSALRSSYSSSTARSSSTRQPAASSRRKDTAYRNTPLVTKR